MAAVYPEKGGTLQGDIRILSQENEEDSSNAGVPSNPKQIQAEDRGAFVDSRLNVSGPATSKNHAEIDGMNAMQSIIIKEERIEDDEYIQINLNDVGEDSESDADNRNESVQEEENVDVKLRSMRCQDCGQQFTRWEAFKIHLRKHVAEEVKKKTEKKRPLQAENQKAEIKKRREAMDDNKYEEGGEEDEEEFFDSTCQIKPSEIVMVRPRVAMLSEEEKPVYGSSNQVYSCSICGKAYYYLESFKNHQKTHTASEVKNYHQCPDCAKVFRSATGLTTHMKMHRTSVELKKPVELEHNEIHQNKEFWCLSCATGFEDAKSLDMHLLYHNTKRHRCDICFKSFRVPAELSYHYNTHSGFKLYKCNFCHKEFPQLKNLITHRKRHLRDHKTGQRKVHVMKTLIIGSKHAVKATEEFSRRASCETEERQGSDSEDEHNEEVVCNNGSIEGSESDANKKDFDMGSSANSHSMEEEEELVVVEKTRYGVVQREDGHGQVKEEEDDDVVFTGQLSQPTRLQQQGEWRCFECGNFFFQEPELHLHYMKHASGEL